MSSKIAGLVLGVAGTLGSVFGDASPSIDDMIQDTANADKIHIYAPGNETPRGMLQYEDAGDFSGSNLADKAYYITPMITDLDGGDFSDSGVAKIDHMNVMIVPQDNGENHDFREAGDLSLELAVNPRPFETAEQAVAFIEKHAPDIGVTEFDITKDGANVTTERIQPDGSEVEAEPVVAPAPKGLGEQ